MKYALIPTLSILTSCFTAGEHLLVQGPGIKKQKQRIAILQKRLQTAESDKVKAETEVEKLAREIDEAKLTLIRKQIDDYEKKKELAPTLFQEEREALYELIQSGPSPQAFEAQAELDRILQLITELSDEERYVY